MPPETEVKHVWDVSTSTIVRFFIAIIVLVFLYQLRDVLVLLIFSVILASAMEPAIRWFQRHRFPRILATLIIFVGALGVVAFAVYLLIPLLAEDLQGFTLTYPGFERQVLRGFENVANLPFIDFIRENTRNLLSQPQQYISSFSGGVFSFTNSFFGGLFSMIIVTVISFYLAARDKGIEDFIQLVVPLRYEAYALDLWARSQRKIGQWLRGQLLLGALVGALIYLGLTLLGIKHALLFAFLTAILELVPIVGPILAAVPVTLIAFLQSPFLALMVIILYVVVQQLESHLIVPLVMKSTVGLSPIVVIIALLVGAKLAGIFGLLLAVPIAAICLELVNDLDKKKRSVAP